MKASLLKSGTRQGSHHFFQYHGGNSSSGKQARKRNEMHIIGKEAVKSSLVAQTMNLHIENSKKLTTNLLELIHEFSKVVEHKKNFKTWTLKN